MCAKSMFKFSRLRKINKSKVNLNYSAYLMRPNEGEVLFSFKFGTITQS